MEWLIELEDSTIERKSRLPHKHFFLSNDTEEQDAVDEVKTRIEDCDCIVLTDPDADGLAGVAAVKQKHDNVGRIDCGPHSQAFGTKTGLELVDNHAPENIPIYVIDICPDSIESVIPLRSVSESHDVYWWDHHDWPDEIRRAVRGQTKELVIDEKHGLEQRCGASIAIDRLEEQGVTFSQELTEAVYATKVYDCWLKETDENGVPTHEFIHPKARDLHEYSEVASPEKYISTILEYGANITDSDSVSDKIDERRTTQENYMDIVVDRARWSKINGWDVAITYGRGPINDIACELKRDGADLAVIIRPSGGVSFRGSSSFKFCAEVARNFNGGGHEKAASAFIAPRNNGDTDRWETDMLDYSQHWLSNGAGVRERIVSYLEEFLHGKVKTDSRTKISS